MRRSQLPQLVTIPTQSSPVPNFTVRPGTWVTEQTGNIGYTL